MDRSPWVVLGIAPDADAINIRRAYAKRLREIRPDKDAQGFQRLVEARDLALQLASGARADARLAHAILRETFGTPANDTRQPQHEPDISPRAARVPSDSLAADPSVEASTEPQDILDALQRTLAAEDLAGWQTVVRATSELSQRQRAALEPYLIESLIAFAAQESPNCAAWPPNKWSFFALVAAWDEEFGWHENDRLLYGVLDEQAAQDFIVLLQWARNLASVDTGARADVQSRGPAPIALRDLHHFYDGGRDRQGLDAYWLMVNDPSLWRACDAATYLFFPGWSLQDGRYGRAGLGLLGWVALILAFAPWRSAAVTNAIPALPKDGLGVLASILTMVVALWYLIGSTPPQSPHRKTHLVGPLWDNLAFLAFPVWALARRLYVRAAVGLIAWFAIAYQLHTFEQDLGLLAAIMLVAMLHLTASEYGQRWVVYKLQRTVAAADGHRIFDAKERANFLRRHGTRSLRPKTDHPRQVRTISRSRDGLPWWWTWLIAFAVIAAMLRAIAAFW